MRLTNENVKLHPTLRDLAIFLGLTIYICLPTTWAAETTTLSDKRLCADPKCERIISMGRTKIMYNSGGKGLIPFKINSPVRILSKSAGTNKQLWGVDIAGRRGYANKDFILEERILISEKDLEHEVPVVGPGSPPAAAPEAPLKATEVEPPVPSASESADEVATTTTSPLDVKGDAIVTKKDTLNDQQVPDVPTASSQVEQLVDGTRLPMEAVPAVTERTQDQQVDKSQAASAAVDTKEPQPVAATTESNESQQQQLPEKVVADQKEPTPAVTEPPKLQQVEDKPKEPTEAASDTKDSEPVTVAPVMAINADIDDDSDDFDYEEDDDEEVDQYDELKIVSKKDNETLNEVANDKKPINVNETHELKPNLVEQTLDKSAPPSTVEGEPITEEKPVEPQAEVPAAKQKNEQPIPSILESIASAKEAPKEDTTERQLEEIVAPKGVPETATPVVQEVVARKELPETKTPSVEEVTEGVQVPKMASIEETLKENVVEQPKAAEIGVQSEPETAKVEPLVSVEASTTVSPIVELPPVATEPSVGLPPLFNNQNFANPNEYYKQLQERQEALNRQPSEASIDDPNDYYKQQQEKAEEEQLKQQQAEVEEQLKQEEQAKVAEQLRQQQQAQIEEQLKQQQQAEAEEQLKQQQQAEAEEQLKQQQQAEAEEQLKQEQAKKQQESNHQLPEQTTPTPSYEAPYAAVDDEPTAAPHSEEVSSESAAVGSVEPLALPSTAIPASESLIKEDGLAGGGGLFATIVDTVNTFISSQGSKTKENVPLEERSSDELQRILYPGMVEKPSNDVPPADVDIHGDAEAQCARYQSNDNDHCHRTISLDNFVEVLAAKLVDHSQLLLCVVIAAASSLFFSFGYYCFCNSSQEGALLSKLNHLERSLLTSHKENLIIKNDLMTTRTKLASIEDNSFGSNDMVVALKKQLEIELYEKGKLQEQVSGLERDLDKAAEAGLELNTMLSDVLGNQNGNEAIMLTADELQRQINDQRMIIEDINSSLAEKSRENSELQYAYTESTARLSSELKALQEDNYELDMEKSKLKTRLEDIQAENEQELAKALEARNYEMQRLQNQILDLTTKWEREHSDLQTSLAKIEALEDCLKAVKKDANLNVHELISSAKTRGELNAAQKKFSDLQSKLEQEQVHKGRLESQLKQSNADVEQLKQDFNQAERDKLEAQTRLEVLSGYFREKENELKTELSLQETKWLQHQGENSSTVETQTLMKNEIQTLKSQNDELRAEIEAQIASHKAQMGTLENRAHESWLAARQSERRCEEALAEAAGLRRKLTTMAAGGDPATGESISSNGGDSKATTAPSPLPLPLPLPGSPLLNMPNPLPFLAAPFSPFMGLPPPFLPPAAAGGARPPPLGRMRSPPPAASGSRGHRDRDRERYSDYSDYDDYDDDEEDDRRRRHSGSWGRGRRDSYSRDSPRTYRSLSPSDSRYNYRHDTETDYSPPPSPPRPVASGHRNGPGPGTVGTGTGAASRTYSEV
ncbi:transport and Golgi organization protein 1 isoform X2 [Drosophila subobscura]|uniref:transport and Golgi organization protein 1 isoform X2 n=1 Tax=Drosophila subobscura TaxID=7241 RepID=UPI00155A7D35|nr:transport and Golgi organization protein 1 isoform X2 [Drosophila subobscura]